MPQIYVMLQCHYSVQCYIYWLFLFHMAERGHVPRRSYSIHDKQKIGFPEFCGKPKSIGLRPLLAGRPMLFSSYRLSRPIIILFVAGPQFEGKRKHRSVKKSGQEQMTNEWPPAKQLVVGANAQYYQKNVETSNELRIQTLHGYRGGGIVQHWLHGQWPDQCMFSFTHSHCSIYPWVDTITGIISIAKLNDNKLVFHLISIFINKGLQLGS